MNKKYDKYPSYKLSGIEWLGKVPEHWEISLLKRFSKKVFTGKTPPTNEYDLSSGDVNWYTPADFGERIKLGESSRKITQEAVLGCKLSLFPSNTVMIVGIGATLGNVGITNKESFANQQINAIVANQFLSPKYLAYFLTANKNAIISYSNASTLGILNQDDTKNLPLLLPPLPEQKAITAFLDDQTTRIDRLIQKKKRLLEMLNEQRQAIITRAVTKGIKPGVPMKDSGIEWLGKVPEHWGLNRLKFYAQINPVKSEVSSLPDDFLVTFTPMEAVKEFGGLDTSVEKPKEEVYQGYTYFKDGDVLTAKITPCFENGKAAIAESLKNGIGFGTTELHVLRAGKKLDNRFLFYMIISEPFLKVGESEMLGAGGQKRVRQEFIENWIWAFPPVDVQKSIVHFIEKQSSKIDQLKSKIQTAIEKLEEYRSSLITQTVTGKIDVREKTSQKKTKKKRANIYFKRTVLAARILDELHAEPTMGRIKLQKILYLLEKHIEKIQLAGKYVKAAAGPFDNKLMRSIEKQLKDRSWFIKSGRKNGYGYKYIPGANKEGYMEYYPRYWGDVESEISNFLDLVRTEKTDLLSYAATLYACWNDFLIKEVDFDGKKLINESRYNWHEEKKEIPYKDWKAALNWLWNNNIKPSGSGDLTKEL